jgi:hypothetical protein
MAALLPSLFKDKKRQKAANISKQLGACMTKPPAQGGSAGAVDTALAALGYGHAAYLRHSVIYTYCALWLVRQAQSPTGRQRPQALHTEL